MPAVCERLGPEGEQGWGTCQAPPWLGLSGGRLNSGLCAKRQSLTPGRSYPGSWVWFHEFREGRAAVHGSFVMVALHVGDSGLSDPGRQIATAVPSEAGGNSAATHGPRLPAAGPLSRCISLPGRILERPFFMKHKPAGYARGTRCCLWVKAGYTRGPGATARYPHPAPQATVKPRAPQRPAPSPARAPPGRGVLRIARHNEAWAPGGLICIAPRLGQWAARGLRGAALPAARARA